MRFPATTEHETIIRTVKNASPPEQSSQVDLSQLQIRQADVPSVFGIGLSPGVSGALLAVLGVGGGLYLLLNQVMPAWENAQKLQANLVKKRQGAGGREQGG